MNVKISKGQSASSKHKNESVEKSMGPTKNHPYREDLSDENDFGQGMCDTHIYIEKSSKTTQNHDVAKRL